MPPNPNKLAPNEIRKNRERFVEWFDRRSKTELEIRNHVCTITYGFHSPDIADRSDAIDSFLTSSSPKAETNSWARTLFAELAFEDMLQKHLGQVFHKHGLMLVSSPTSLDKSRNDNQPWNEYGEMHLLTERDLQAYKNGQAPFNQKGVDLLLLSSSQEAILGIDITLGSHSTINSKRGYPPLNPFLAMPTIVLPLQNLPIASHIFPTFINKIVRQNILQHGEMRLQEWVWGPNTIDYLQQNIHNGIKSTRTRLNQDFEFMKSYPYANTVHSKLDTVEQLFTEYLQ